MNLLTELYQQNPLLLVIVIWSIPWTFSAMWKAAQNGHKVWYIALLIINTAGVLPMLYIFYFSKNKNPFNKKKENRKDTKKID